MDIYEDAMWSNYQVRGDESKQDSSRQLIAQTSGCFLLLRSLYLLFISCRVCNMIPSGEGPQRADLHKNAPAHKSLSLMSELIDRPSGHLQVINAISGCQLTPHRNSRSLWNTNGNTGSSVRQIRGSVWKQRRRKCIEWARRPPPTLVRPALAVI